MLYSSFNYRLCSDRMLHHFVNSYRFSLLHQRLNWVELGKEMVRRRCVSGYRFSFGEGRSTVVQASTRSVAKYCNVTNKRKVVPSGNQQQPANLGL